MMRRHDKLKVLDINAKFAESGVERRAPHGICTNALLKVDTSNPNHVGLFATEKDGYGRADPLSWY